MIKSWPRSLQVRLALRVAILYAIATIVVIGVLMTRAFDAARSIGDRELMMRATELSRLVSVGEDGVPRLDQRSHPEPAVADAFAIRDGNGRIVAASPLDVGGEVAGWPPATDEPAHFQTRGAGSEDAGYDGISIKAQSAAGPLSIAVARPHESTALTYALLRKFIHDIIWAVSFLVLATLVIGIFAIRSGLKSVRGVSEMATAIGPHATSVRLPDKDLPSEIKPLVTAVNSAFDRLEQGFTVQRQFTADAAHELRTPLAIITAAIDAMEGDGELTKLKADVARMNRLVEQLLRVARLDAIAVDVGGTVDLNEVARGVVEVMAPWALTRERAIAFNGPEAPVYVRGNGFSIADAIRNLVENAVTHSPVGTEVMVRTSPAGTVSVADQGPGVSAEDRQRMFDRFWRGKGAPPQGAGLGLAIVKEIVNMHRGTVAVAAGPNGGAVFTLGFILARQLDVREPAAAAPVRKTFAWNNA